MVNHMGSDLLAHAKRREYGRAERVSRRQSLATASQVNEVKTETGEKEWKFAGPGPIARNFKCSG
jgi:hypothetical protein